MKLSHWVAWFTYFGLLFALAKVNAVSERVAALEVRADSLAFAVQIEAMKRERADSAHALTARYDAPLHLAYEIVDAALAEGIDPDLGARLVRVESAFRVRARGRHGEIGLTQIKPSTAADVCASERECELRLMDDPAINLRLGFRYLRLLLIAYGDERAALTAYNMGPTAFQQHVDRYGREPRTPYAGRVLR